MKCPFVKYKNILGEPGKGVHRFRFLNSAVVDYILTLLVAGLTTFLSGVPIVITTVGWFILGFVLHILFGVETYTLKYLGIKCK